MMRRGCAGDDENNCVDDDKKTLVILIMIGYKLITVLMKMIVSILTMKKFMTVPG